MEDSKATRLRVDPKRRAQLEAIAVAETVRSGRIVSVSDVLGRALDAGIAQLSVMR